LSNGEQVLWRDELMITRREFRIVCVCRLLSLNGRQLLDYSPLLCQREEFDGSSLERS